MELTQPAPAGSTSPLSALFTLFYEPGKTFAALEQRRAAWVPLIVLMVSSVLLLAWFFGTVDLGWLLDQMLASVKDPAQRANAHGMLSRNGLMASGVAGAMFGLPIMFAVVGVYFMFAGKIVSKEFTFGKGFALAAWASMPGALALPLGAMQMLLASGKQLSPSDLNPTSLNTLLFHYPMSHPMTSLLDSVSVLSVWSALLMVIGFQLWAKVSRAKAVMVVALAYAVLYGAWFAFALSRTI